MLNFGNFRANLFEFLVEKGIFWMCHIGTFRLSSVKLD